MKSGVQCALLLGVVSACAAAPARETQGPWRPSSTPVVVHPPNCQVVAAARRVKQELGEVAEVGTVHLEGERIPLESLWPTEGWEAERRRGARAPACLKVPALGPDWLPTTRIADGSTCFVITYASEASTDAFFIFEDGEEAFRAFIGAQRLFKVNGHWLLLWQSYSARLAWGISRVHRGPDGRWRLEPAIDREGKVYGFAFDSRGRLLLRVNERADWCGTPWRLYRLEDGRLEVLG